MEYFPVPYSQEPVSEEEVQRRSLAYYEKLNRRRSLRFFSDKSIPPEVINHLILAASSAPSGANKQPWTFCVISNPDLKKKIREAAEQEEYRSYNGRLPEAWLRDLAPLGTDWRKPFLEIAPYLIVVFKRIYEINAEGEKHNNYYVNESVGIACGFLLTAIHEAGLVTLTHTPSPMDFLSELLERPQNERPYLLLPVGYPAEGATVPDIGRKSLEEVAVWFR